MPVRPRDNSPTSNAGQSTRPGQRHRHNQRCTWSLERLESRTLLSSGQLDTNFGYQGAAPILGAPIQEIVSDSEGRLLVAGAYSMSRFTADGQTDATFASLGTLNVPGGGTDVGDNYIDDVALEPDGKILAYVDNPNAVMVDRFYSDGAVDTTFGTNGSTTAITIDVSGQQLSLSNQDDNNLKQIAVLSDGRIVIAGSISVPSVGQVAALAMLSPAGALDTSFNGNGTLELPFVPGAPFNPAEVINLAVNDSHILVLTTNGNGVRLYQFNPDGSIDTRFGSNGHIDFEPTEGLADRWLVVLPEGQFLLWAIDTSQRLNGTTELIGRYNAEGTPDATFGSDGVVTDASNYIGALDNDIAVQPNGKLVITDASEQRRAAGFAAIERRRQPGYELRQ